MLQTGSPVFGIVTTYNKKGSLNIAELIIEGTARHVQARRKTGGRSAGCKWS
jgi:hypothetical protein